MSKFYQYINEKYGKSRIEPISETDAKETIRFNCQKSAQSTEIYRGVPSFKDKYGFGNSEKSDILRVSANTQNYYTLILDNSKEWKAFPNRSESFICSTSVNEAGTYGELYRVFPFDGTPMGVCSKLDIWKSFKDFFVLMQFNDFIYTMASYYLGNINTTKMEEDYNYLLKTFDKIGKWISKEVSEEREFFTKFNQDIQDFINGWLDSNIKNFSDYILKRFSPRLNNFKLKKAGNNLPENNEIWFSGKAIFINTNRINHIEVKQGSVLNWATNTKDGDKGVMVT